MTDPHIRIPQGAQPITWSGDHMQVPDHPIVLYVEGDGIGVDITPVMQAVVDAAVARAYGHQRRMGWTEIYAGEKATRVYGQDQWLPQSTLDALSHYHVGIKGPLATPVGGGIRSINVALRQQLDLYVCMRPVRYFPGTPSPVKSPELVHMVIFRENAEDIYAGIEWEADSQAGRQVIDWLRESMGVTGIRFPEHCGIGIKPVSRAGTQRLVKQAIDYAIEHERESVTLVHKGNIMKFTEGAFRDWGYALARDVYGAVPIDGGPWHELRHPRTGKTIVIKDIIADAFLQHILIKPQELDVIATLNLNGDYISDALAAQVGGIGMAPGANLGDRVALFEATHGTAPGYAGLDQVNPSSLILSAEMMLRHMGWTEAADIIMGALEQCLARHCVTYDLARLMDDVEPVSCSGFGEALIQAMS